MFILFAPQIHFPVPGPQFGIGSEEKSNSPYSPNLDLTLHGAGTLTEVRFKGNHLVAEANYTLEGIEGSDLNITGSGSVTVMGGAEPPMIFQFMPGVFTITHADGSEVQILEMGLEVDITNPNNPYLYGYVCLRVTGGGRELEAELIFASNGMGGGFMHVKGADWDFVVP